MKNGIELNLVKLETPRNSRNNDDRRAEVHLFVLLVVQTAFCIDLLLGLCMCMYVYLYACVCEDVCAE